ncbi:helix-turn-helix domain-containing protein [Microvirga sp. STR05]|uniref:Helix-turn-helix domain-containing protein n=1 Tax=Hymenobacter duratus TaxID=2771356 RepID=A0ABR8JJS0_9BACT|nr:helix-turn-helix domain-containing protein [Hymenobacter duratus]MBR7952025.1 helix-turn-helix domain-containing protein [Microvirga sp. STR05]
MEINTKLALLTPQELQELLTLAALEALKQHTATPVASYADTVLTVREVAKRLRRSEKFVRDEIARGRLGADNSNKGVSGVRASWRVRETDVAHYLKRLR